MKRTIVFLLIISSFIDISAQQPSLVLPIGHTGTIYSVCFSPNGKRVLSASQDKTAKIWDSQTGALLSELKGNKDELNKARYSPDGKRIITIEAYNNSFKLWDADSAQFMAEINENSGYITDVFFSPDSKMMAASSDGKVFIWELSSGRKITTLVDGGVFSSLKLSEGCFSPDSKKMLTISSEAFIWDIATAKVIKIMDGHSQEIICASFSPDGRKIITNSRDSSTMVWNAKNEKPLFRISHHSGIASFAGFGPDGTKIVTVDHDSTIRIWDAKNGKLLQSNPNSEGLTDAIFSPDGKYLLSTGWDYKAKFLDLQTGRKLVIDSQLNSAIGLSKFSTDGKKIVTASSNKVYIRDVGTLRLLTTLEGHASRINDASFNNEGNLVVSAGDDGYVRVWDMEKSILLRAIAGHNLKVNSATFSKDSKYIVSGSDDSTVKIWDSETGKLFHSLTGHKDAVFSARPDPAGINIVSASKDRTARIWDIQNGKLRAELNGHSDWVYDAEFSPDGKRVVTGSWDNMVSIWDAGNGKPLWWGFQKLSDWVTSVCFSPDGSSIMTASRNKFAKIWDADNSNFVQVFDGHSDGVKSARFNSSGDKVVTASRDNSAKVWDTKTGKILLDLKGHSSELRSAYFSPGDKLIITSSYDNTCKVWDAANGKLKYTFFALDSSDYFFQTPDGFYKTTSAGAKLLHYVTKDLKTISFEQLDVKYNRPDKVLEALGNQDTALIRSYRRAWEKRIKKLGIDTTQFSNRYSVPECDFADRDNIEYEQKNGSLKLQVKATDAIFKLDRFNIWVNEAPLFGQRGISIRRKNANQLDTIITILLSEGENRIEASITNVNGTESYRMPLIVNYTPAVKQSVTTHFIGIGIDKFKDSKNNLRYSSKDIRDLSLKLKEKYGSSVTIDTLFNENVTISNVKALKEKLAQTSVNDKVIISYSGHGLLSSDFNYYLSTYDINFEKPEEEGLPYDELENLLDSIPARKKLMLIDACHSGEVDKEELVRINKASDSLHLTKGGITVVYENNGKLGMKNSFELMQSLFVNVGKSTGATIISAAAGTQFALERGDLKNGVFTYCILEAMEKNKTMKISELKKIVGQRVEELTNGLQKPTSRNENIAVDWSVW